MSQQQVKTVKGEIAQANERIAALEAGVLCAGWDHYTSTRASSTFCWSNSLLSNYKEYKSLTSQLTDEDAQKQLADVKEQVCTR